MSIRQCDMESYGMRNSAGEIWRKRVGVEPTILAAKDRINGFEGHEGHRTPFASAVCERNMLPA